MLLPGFVCDTSHGMHKMHQVALPCVQVLDFASRRLEQLLLDRGYQIEAVRAVMQESNRDPARVQAAVQQLQVSQLFWH